MTDLQPAAFSVSTSKGPYAAPRRRRHLYADATIRDEDSGRSVDVTLWADGRVGIAVRDAEGRPLDLSIYPAGNPNGPAVLVERTPSGVPVRIPPGVEYEETHR